MSFARTNQFGIIFIYEFLFYFQFAQNVFPKFMSFFPTLVLSKGTLQFGLVSNIIFTVNDNHLLNSILQLSYFRCFLSFLGFANSQTNKISKNNMTRTRMVVPKCSKKSFFLVPRNLSHLIQIFVVRFFWNPFYVFCFLIWISSKPIVHPFSNW